MTVRDIVLQVAQVAGRPVAGTFDPRDNPASCILKARLVACSLVAIDEAEQVVSVHRLFQHFLDAKLFRACNNGRRGRASDQ